MNKEINRLKTLSDYWKGCYAESSNVVIRQSEEIKELKREIRIYDLYFKIIKQMYDGKSLPDSWEEFCNQKNV